MSKATALLGLGAEPSVREVKTAYQQLCLLHHPDVGGSAERFQLIHDAYVTALEEAEERPCENCRGRGKLVVQRGWTTVEITCPDCGGTGY